MKSIYTFQNIAVTFFTFTVLSSCVSFSTTLSNIETVHKRFRDAGIKNGFVQIDSQNRLILKGEYENDLEVDKAFSIAQTIAGVRYVSPVTPNSIKVKNWVTKLSLAMSKGFESVNTPSPNLILPSISKPPRAIEKKYALVVGIRRFKENDLKDSELVYADKDAGDVRNYLVDPKGGGFSDVTFLSNEQATRNNILNALTDLQNKATENDLVFLYFSTHGALPDKNGSVSVVTYDTEVRPRENIWYSSLNEDILKNFIQSVQSERIVVVLDVCYSGRVYRQIPGFLASGSKYLEDDEENFSTGRSSQDMDKRLLGAKDLILPEEESDNDSTKMQNWRKILISSSNGGEKSWEPSGEAEVSNIKNSFFTYYFLEGMRKYQGDVRQAFAYAQPAVIDVVAKIKHNPQHPQLTTFYPNANVKL